MKTNSVKTTSAQLSCMAWFRDHFDYAIGMKWKVHPLSAPNHILPYSMMVSKLCKQRQQHARHRGKGVPNLGALGLTLRCRHSIRVAVCSGRPFGVMGRAVFLHGMHGDVPGCEVHGQWIIACEFEFLLHDQMEMDEQWEGSWRGKILQECTSRKEKQHAGPPSAGITI